MKKKLLSIGIAVCILLGIAVVPVSAEGDYPNLAIVAKIDDYDVTLVLADGSIKTYEVKDNAVFLSAYNAGSNIYAVGTITTTTIPAANRVPNDVYGINSVVEYTLKNGRIISLVYQTPTAFINTNAVTNGEYRAEISRIGTIGINQYTSILDVSWGSNYRYYKGMAISELIDGEKYAGVGFGKITGTNTYSLVLLTNTGYVYNSKSRFAVIDADSWSAGLDADGDTVDQLKVLVNGQKTTLNFEYGFANPSNYAYFTPVRGTAFFYTVDSDGLVDSVNLITMSQIVTNGGVTLAGAFGMDYDYAKWGTTLIYGTQDYRLVQGIVIDADNSTVKLVCVPVASDSPVDFSNYESLTLADDCLIYTYNTAEEEDSKRLNAKGSLVASDFNSWRITEIPGSPQVGGSVVPAASGYSTADLAKWVWTTTPVAASNADVAYNGTNYDTTAELFAAARGIKTGNAAAIANKTTEQAAQYAMALVIDDEVVEIYEILQDIPYSNPIHYGDDPVTVAADTFKTVSFYDSTIKFGSTKYIIDQTVDVYVNGYLFKTLSGYYDFGYTLDSIIGNAFGDIRLEKSSSSLGGYNEIYVEDYEIFGVSDIMYTGGVTTVNLSQLVSTNISSYENIKISDAELTNGFDRFSVTLDGEEIELKDLKKNDIIAIKTKINPYASTISPVNGNTDISILVSRKTVSGKLTAVDVDDYENNFTIDGIDYKAVDKYGIGLALGTVYANIYLDPFGRLVAYDDEAVLESRNYGIVAKIDDYDVTLVLADGSIRTYEVKDDAVFLSAYFAGNIYAVGTITTTTIPAANRVPNDVYGINSVVEYTLKNGRIISLVYQTPTAFINTNAVTNGEYRAEISRIGTIGINQYTSILDVSWGSNYRYYKGMAISELIDGEKYAGVGFGKITGTNTYSLVLLTNTGYVYNSKSRFAVIDADSWSAGLDADGDTVDQLKVLVNGQKTTLNFEYGFANPSNYAYFTPVRGTAFFYTVDSDGLVDSVNLITMSQIVTNGGVTLAGAFGMDYDYAKWGTTLIYGTQDYRLVQGIVIDADNSTVKLVCVPVASDSPVDFSNYESLTLADDCLIYTYNTAEEEDSKRLNAKGSLVASDFNSWRITEIPGSPQVGGSVVPAASGYSTADLAKWVWTTTPVAASNADVAYNGTNYDTTAELFAAARGIKTGNAAAIANKTTEQAAQYAMALVIDDEVVEIYEILQDIPYSNPIHYGDVTGDGKITSKDDAFLARYLAHWSGYDETTVDLYAADVNCDSKITLKDNAILARHIAKWIRYETLPYLQ